MADRYWVGGTGTWDATTTTNWSATSGGSGGASAPTSVDNVFFNVNSNIGTGAFTVTITAATCLNFTASGLDGVMTVDSSATNAPLDVYGSMTLPTTNLIWSPPIGITLTFRGTTSNTLTTNGVTVNTTNVTLDAVGGTLSLGSALALNSTRNLFITNGTFTTTASNYTITAGAISSNNLNVRSILLNASALTLTSATPLTFAESNLTFSAGTSTITVSTASSTFAGGNQTFNNVTFSSTVAGTTTITGANTFNVLTQAAVATAGLRLFSLTGNQIIATLTLSSGASAVTRTLVQSNTLGTQRTLTVATLTAISDVDFRDIVAAGASGTWSGTRLGDCKNNSNITFGAGVTKYWSTVAGVSASWSGTAWATSSGGVPALNNFPLAQDTCIIDNSGATTGNGLRTGNTVTIDANWQMGTLNFSGRTVAFNWTQGNSDPFLYGDVTLTTAMTMTTVAGTPSWSFANQGTVQTVNSAGVTIRLNNFSINSPNGGVSLTANTTVDLSPIVSPNVSGTVTLAAGTLTLNNNTLTTVAFNSSASIARTLAFGTTGKIVLTAISGSPWSTSTATNLTVTGTNPLIQLTNNTAFGTTRTVVMGNAGEANAISMEVTAGADTIAIGTTSGSYKNLSTVGFTGTLNFTNSIAIYGNFDAGGATAIIGGGDPQFLGASGTKTIRSNGLSFPDNISFAGVGGTWSLQDALSVVDTITFTSGTLTTNGYAVTADLFNSNNTNTRVLNLGASTVTITGIGQLWDITDPTNMTLNSGTSTITTTGNSANITFAGGGLTYYNISLGATYYNLTVTGANTFNNFTVASPVSVGRRAIEFESNQTINGALSCSGSAANSRPRLVGAVGGTTLTVASVAALSNVDFADIIAAGASSPWSGTRLGNFGGNTNITFATPKTVYWNQPAGGNWSDVAWATSSGGAVNVNNFPLGQDTAVLNNTGVGASTTIVMDYGWVLPSISAGSLTNALTINWNIFNGLTAGMAGINPVFSSAITLTQTAGNFAFNPLSNSTITTAGISFPMLVAFSSPSVTITLADNFISANTSQLVAGTLNLNGKTLSCTVFDSTFADLEVRAIAFNGGQINVTGNNATVWACENLTNFSYTGTPTVNFTYSGSSGTRTVSNGGTAGATEFNVVDFNVTAGSDDWTVLNSNSVRNLNFTGFSGTSSLFGTGFIYGNLTLSPTQTISGSPNETTFAATSGTKTITTNGVTINRQILFNGIGGTWELQDALTLGTTQGNLRFWAGTITTNNYAVTCLDFKAQASTAVGDRTLNLGSSAFTLLGSSTSNASWQTEAGAYLLTINAGTSTIYLAEAYTGTSQQLFYGGNKTYYNVVISGGQPSGFYQSNTFNSISNTVQPLELTFEAGTTQTVNNFNVSGTSGNLVTMVSSTPSTQWSIAKNTGGKVLISFCSITDSAATPAGYWFAPTSQGNIDGGNNTGWNFGTVGGAGGFLPFF